MSRLPQPFAKALALCFGDYDHAARRNCFGQRLVFVVWSNGALVIPLLRACRKTEYTIASAQAPLKRRQDCAIGCAVIHRIHDVLKTTLKRPARAQCFSKQLRHLIRIIAKYAAAPRLSRQGNQTDDRDDFVRWLVAGCRVLRCDQKARCKNRVRGFAMSLRR